MERRNYITSEKQAMNVVQQIAAVIMAVLLAVAAFFVTFILTGCSGTGEYADESPQGRADADRSGSAIAFTADTEVTSVSDGDGTARTRTAPGTMTLDGSGSTVSLRDRGFGVFACHTGVHPYVSTSTTANLMYNQLVTYNGSTGHWEYDPLVYWPNSDDGVPEYVTFFAYAPHSSSANGCIADMSRPDETGDPWILYQLGGSEVADGDGGWKSQQVDLLYDFRKDQKREFPIAGNKVNFDFRHALATIGDRVTVTVGESVKNRLKAIYFGTPVTLTVSTITIDYLLTRKGRLVLNSATQPNWQAVESEDAKVHRILTYSPNLVMAQATSSSACSTADFSTGEGQGVFYIPLESGADRQKVTVSAQYTVTTGSPAYVISEGTIEATADLSYISSASESRNLNVTIQIPEIACSGAPLASAAVGQVICSHGKAFPASLGNLVCGGEKVAVVAYKGSGSGEGSPYNHGLAIAMRDAAASVPWCNQTASACLPLQVSSLADALGHRAGASATGSLAAGAEHQAAAAASGYTCDGSAAAGAHPDGTSPWFLPALGQWNLMVKAMTGGLADLSQSENSGYKAAGFNVRIAEAGGTGLAPGLYWTSTESSAANAWYVSFKDGKANSTSKVTNSYVRAVLAF